MMAAFLKKHSLIKRIVILRLNTRKPFLAMIFANMSTKAFTVIKCTSIETFFLRSFFSHHVSFVRMQCVRTRLAGVSRCTKIQNIFLYYTYRVFFFCFSSRPVDYLYTKILRILDFVNEHIPKIIRKYILDLPPFIKDNCNGYFKQKGNKITTYKFII